MPLQDWSKFSCHYINVWAYLQQDEIVCMCERERSKTKGDEVQNNPCTQYLCVCILHPFLFQLQEIRDDKSLYFYYTKTTHVSER